MSEMMINAIIWPIAACVVIAGGLIALGQRQAEERGYERGKIDGFEDAMDVCEKRPGSFTAAVNRRQAERESRAKMSNRTTKTGGVKK